MEAIAAAKEKARLRKEQDLAYIEDNEELRVGCNPRLPNLSVGDFFVDNSTLSLKEYKAKNKVFILALSDSTCDNCCKGENLLEEIRQMFIAGDISYKGKHLFCFG